MNVLSCTGEPTFSGEVLIENERIVAMARYPKHLFFLPIERRINGAGATLMPGLIEPHVHLSFTDVSNSVQLGEIPPEDLTLLTAQNAHVMLDHGFTACVSAASAKPRIDVAVRNFINSGAIPGPRLLAASPELTVPSGLGDARFTTLNLTIPSVV